MSINAAEYQRAYRETHPEYVRKNIEQGIVRGRQRNYLLKIELEAAQRTGTLPKGYTKTNCLACGKEKFVRKIDIARGEHFPLAHCHDHKCQFCALKGVTFLSEDSVILLGGNVIRYHYLSPSCECRRCQKFYARRERVRKIREEFGKTQFIEPPQEPPDASMEPIDEHGKINGTIILIGKSWGFKQAG